jgi:hypothetical protein
MTTDNQLYVWPSEPYKGLAYYGAEDVLLYAGREVEVNDCVHLLADLETGMLLLHGKTGCGKSSFLRAGLIPELERRGFGFQFLRTAGGHPVFIRCGADPTSHIADEVYRFLSHPRQITTADGDTTVDLAFLRTICAQRRLYCCV